MASINSSKCVLVVGATSGIGQHLALAILALPSKPTVIISGRRRARLNEIIAQNASTSGGRLRALEMDIDVDAPTLERNVTSLLKEYPELDSVIFSAGIQREIDFAQAKPATNTIATFASELNTNYIAIATMIHLLLPHLLARADGGKGQPGLIVPITSGLAYVSAAWIPGYCASKAAMHSLSVSLGVQLKGTGVRVVEILPPLVESELHDHESTTEALSARWMPLAEFTPLALAALTAEPRADENYVEATIGNSQDWHNKWESGKMGLVNAMFNGRPAKA